MNLPLLYGVGVRAFKRLQEEIMRQSEDESIFAHNHSSEMTPLARHPQDFLRSDGLTVYPGFLEFFRALESAPYHIT